MPDLACLNGTIQPLEDTRVSVNDRGFLFGDAVYEVIRTYGGQPFRMTDHLDRLEKSMAAIRIHPDRDRATVEKWIHDVCNQAGYDEAKIYLQVSRGVAPRDHAFPDVSPTVLITVTPIAPLPAEMTENGVAALSTPDIRWARCDVKSVNLLPNVLARQAARDAGAFEALFVDDDGFLLEGATSNVFAVDGGTIVTPPLDPHILPGVSRAYLMELAKEHNIPLAERPIPMDTLATAEELFLTGTTIEILPVNQVDGKPIGNGDPGPITRTLQKVFRPAHAATPQS